MPVRPIVRLGHPVLRSPAQALVPEQVGESELQQVIDDMVETMRAAGGVGLAAPQIGVALQLFVYEAPGPTEGQTGTADRSVPIPLQVVVNPMITPQGGELVYQWEGCLSIPDLRGLVPRQSAVRVRGLDRQGQSLDFAASGFEARIVQHEFDHLNGVLFLDRMGDLKTLAFSAEWEHYLLGEGRSTGGTAVG